MSETTLSEQLVKYLADAHSIEEQALTQMKKAKTPKVAGDERLAQIFAAHETETEEHRRLVDARLEAHDASPSKVKDLVMRAGGNAFAAFAALNVDTPGKLAAHGYSYEHLELASYELLARVAERAGDAETATVARTIAGQEEAMGERIAHLFDVAAEASLAKGGDDLADRVTDYLADAHALEEQAAQLLEAGAKQVDDPVFTQLFREHLAETREHEQLVRGRLEALDSSPSRLKDAALRLGALNWGGFFGGHPDTTGKLAAFSYAFEHLEIGGYELLRRVAERAGDRETAALAERILTDERGAARKIAAQWDHAVEIALAEQHVTV